MLHHVLDSETKQNSTDALDDTEMQYYKSLPGFSPKVFTLVHSLKTPQMAFAYSFQPYQPSAHQKHSKLRRHQILYIWEW